MSSFHPVEYLYLGVGRRIKQSKVKHTWKFHIDDTLHTVHFFDSKVSGKRKVLFDGDIVMQSKRSNSRDPLVFAAGTHMITVAYDEIGFCDLYCDNISFQAQTKKEAAKENEGYVTKVVVPKVPTQPLQPSAQPAQPVVAQVVQPVAVQRVIQPAQNRAVSSVVKPENVFDFLGVPVKAPTSFVPASEEFVPLPIYSKLGSVCEAPSKVQTPAVEVLQEEPAKQSEVALFDLDNLHLGDEYSPAVMRKLEEAKKPAFTIADAPNVPMNQLQTQRPAPSGPVYMSQWFPTYYIN